MRRTITFAYGLLCYSVFAATFAYMVGFLANLAVPKSIDSGGAGSTLPALVVDVLLLSLFAVQHSGMARQAFKRRLKSIIPAAAERSTYVLVSSLVLLVMAWQWQPLPASIWEVGSPFARQVVWGICALGWATVFASTFMISHAHLFGLAQVWARLRGRPQPEPRFQTRGLYRYVRHPLMLGFLVAFWATPDMTLGHLVFAAGSTGYILVATLALEERDLMRFLGAPYRRYQRRVPAFIPRVNRGVDASELMTDAAQGVTPGEHAASTS